MEDYRKLLDGAVPLYRIPNTVRPLPGERADLGSRTVYAAGRFRNQKGFDLLDLRVGAGRLPASRLATAAARRGPSAHAA